MTERNQKKYGSREGGLVKAIIVIIIALAFAKYVFDFSIIEFFRSPGVQETLNYTWTVIEIVWFDFIVRPFMFVFEWIKGFVSESR